MSCVVLFSKYNPMQVFISIKVNAIYKIPFFINILDRLRLVPFCSKFRHPCRQKHLRLYPSRRPRKRFE